MNLEEIKAKINEGRPIRHTEIKELIAEMERLTAENADLKTIISPAKLAQIAMMQIEFNRLQTENAVLKKALELMVGEIKSCVLKMSKAGIVRITAWGSDEQCIDYFMKKAQQLTHETHGVDK